MKSHPLPLHRPSAVGKPPYSMRRLPLSGLFVLLLCSVSQADGPPAQPQVDFTKGTAGTWHAGWTGVSGRSYFPQVSADLVNWMWLPLIGFSDGQKGVGMDTGGQPRYFFRLVHTDEPTTDPELEDFSGDGIGSLLKIRMGFSPFAPLAWEDADSDGIHDAVERFWFGNSLAGTDGGGDDANGDGIRDIFEIQAGNDPAADPAGSVESRSDYSYDAMGRLTAADGATYVFDAEGNLESTPD